MGKFLFVIPLLALAACAGRPTIIDSKPSGARILVDDEYVGKSPVSYSFSESGLRFNYSVRAQKDGYYPAEETVSPRMDAWGQGHWPDRVMLHLKKKKKRR